MVSFKITGAHDRAFLEILRTPGAVNGFERYPGDLVFQFLVVCTNTCVTLCTRVFSEYLSFRKFIQNKHAILYLLCVSFRNDIPS